MCFEHLFEQQFAQEVDQYVNGFMQQQKQRSAAANKACASRHAVNASSLLFDGQFKISEVLEVESNIQKYVSEFCEKHGCPAEAKHSLSSMMDFVFRRHGTLQAPKAAAGTSAAQKHNSANTIDIQRQHLGAVVDHSGNSIMGMGAPAISSIDSSNYSAILPPASLLTDPSPVSQSMLAAVERQMLEMNVACDTSVLPAQTSQLDDSTQVLREDISVPNVSFAKHMQSSSVKLSTPRNAKQHATLSEDSVDALLSPAFVSMRMSGSSRSSSTQYSKSTSYDTTSYSSHSSASDRSPLSELNGRTFASPNGSPLHSRASFGGFATPSGPAQRQDENAYPSVRGSVKKFGGYNQYASMADSPVSFTCVSAVTTPGSAKSHGVFSQPPSESSFIDDDEIENLRKHTVVKRRRPGQSKSANASRAVRRNPLNIIRPGQDSQTNSSVHIVQEILSFGGFSRCKIGHVIGIALDRFVLICSALRLSAESGSIMVSIIVICSLS